MSKYSNQYNMTSEEYENEITRKRQENEIKILGDMEREIRNKLTLLEESMKRMRKKKMSKEAIHQRSVSNPEENTADLKNNFQFEPVKTKSTENIVNAVNNKGVLRSSISYDNRRLNKVHVPIVPETRRMRAGTPENYLAEMQPHYNYSQSSEEPANFSDRIERPKTSSGIYSQQIPSVERNIYTRQSQPSHVVKALSTGVATKKYRQYDKENITRVNPAISGALYTKKKSLNAAMPRDQVRWQRNVDTNPTRSTSAFGMYKTNVSDGGMKIGDSNSLTRSRNEPLRTRSRQVESKRRFPGYMEQEERCHSTENLIEKRPLAKTNSTILNSNDFQIISLESRTVAQQIKLKEFEKKYYNENRILTKTEWASFVSKFSETQKEVRNLDNEWQELFNELISYNSEYNDHMNKIRMWVTALKADSKFLQDIMAQNLGTPM